MTSDPEKDDRHRSTSGTEPGLQACSASARGGPSYPRGVTVPLGELARAWIAVGSQSVGGATATIYLMRSRLVERTGWVTRREFMEAYSLAQLSPGIHLIALAALLGQRLAGIRGLVVSVGGMMVPAAIITVALSAALVAIADHPLTRAALAGVAPVTAGMTIGLAIVSARSAVRRGARGALDLLVVVAAFAALVVVPASPITVIAACGAAGALLAGRERRTSERAPVAE